MTARWLFPVLLLAAAPLAAQQTAADSLRRRVGVLADDSMEGRATGSRGLERATRYLEGELRRLGLRPAGLAGYRFPVELERVRTRVSAAVGGDSLGPDELVLLSGSSGYPPSPRPRGEGRLLYGGFLVDTATDAPAAGMSNERINGAVLVLQSSAPTNVPPSPRYSLPSLTGAYSQLGALLLITPDTAHWAYLRSLVRDGALAPRRAAGAGGGPAVFAITPAAAARLFGRSLVGEHGAVDGRGTFRYQVTETRTPVEAANLVAVLPGRDSALAGEYVVLGAHLDHLGVGAAVGGDSILNGADDDASGSAVLLEAADRLASGAERPARSLLFVWHTAEEDGLLGSQAFAQRPSVPRARMVAMINLDMVGRNHPDSLYVIGARRLSSALGDAVDAANAALPRPFRLDAALDDPEHPEHLYCRSDHYSYARLMVPSVYFTGGLHGDYHGVDDEAGTLDYGKLARVTDLVVRLAADLGSARRPVVDRPLPPLGAPCR